MKRAITTVMIIFAGVVAAWGQTSAPTTQNTVSAWVIQKKSESARRIADNPEFMAVIAKIPKELIPAKAAAQGDDTLSRDKKMRAWDATNIDNKLVKIRAFVEDGQNAEFYLPGNPLNQYEVHPKIDGGLSKFNPGDEVIIEGTTGKGGSLLVGVNPWPNGELYYNYHLLVLNAKVTRVASPATQQAPNK